MFFIYNLSQIETVMLISGILFLGGIFYYFSVKSRQSYTCPECGEKITVEHMDTARCGLCGSLLNLDDKE